MVRETKIEVMHLARNRFSQGAGSIPKLVDNGGGKLANPKASLIYFGRGFWEGPRGASIRSAVDGAVARMGDGGLNSLLAEYGVGPLKYTGSTVAAGPAPDFVGERQIQNLALAQRNADLARGGADPETIYTIVLRPGTVLGSSEGTSLQGIGGYHGSVIDGRGRPVLYSAIVFSGPLGRNGINIDGNPVHAITGTISHELAEAATDPYVSQNRLGIYDVKNNQEWADATENALPLDQAFAPNRFGDVVQKLWSPSMRDYVVASGKGAQRGANLGTARDTGAAVRAMLLSALLR